MKLTAQQTAIVESEAKRIVVTGGRMSGKTVTAIERAKVKTLRGEKIAYIVAFPGQRKIFSKMAVEVLFVHDVNKLVGDHWDGIVIDDFYYVDKPQELLLQVEALTCAKKGWILVQSIIDRASKNYKLFRTMFGDANNESHTLHTLCTDEQLGRVLYEAGLLHFNTQYLSIWPADDTDGGNF